MWNAASRGCVAGIVSRLRDASGERSHSQNRQRDASCIALYLAIIIIDLFSLSLSLDYRISLPFIFQIVTNECQVPLDG